MRILQTTSKNRDFQITLNYAVKLFVITTIYVVISVYFFVVILSDKRPEQNLLMESKNTAKC